MSKLDEVAGQFVQGLSIIGANACAVSGRVVDERVDIGDASPLQELRNIGMVRFADKQKSVDATFDQLPDLAVLLFKIVFGTGEQQRASGFG
jgi:hypothetical protein